MKREESNAGLCLKNVSCGGPAELIKEGYMERNDRRRMAGASAG
jgi:hypothetical protein